MLSACCCTVSPTTSSTCFACSYLRRCAQHKSKRCAFSCSRSVRASAKQPVAFAFTWPAAGLFKISSKPSATPPRLSRVFDNTLSQGTRRRHFRKTVREVKTVAVQPLCGSTTGRHPFLRQQSVFRVRILDSYELSRLVLRTDSR